MMQGIELSIIAPVFNGEKSIEEFIQRMIKSLEGFEKQYEIVLVDDGSTDNSLSIMKKYPEVKVVKLERNYGQSNAIAAGLTLAAGRYIVVMDSDLQDKPEDVMLLYEKIRQSNKDMVIACRLEANGIYWRDIGSVTFYYLTMLLTRLKFPWGSGVFRIMHRRCIERLSVALRTPGTVLSFIHAAGYSWETIELPRGKVKQRDSSYNFSKMIHLAFSRIIPYSRIPIEWLGSTLLLRYLPRFSIDKIYKGADDE